MYLDLVQKGYGFIKTVAFHPDLVTMQLHSNSHGWDEWFSMERVYWIWVLSSSSPVMLT